MKKWLKRILIGIVGIIFLVVVLFYSFQAYVYVRYEKSYGEYSTRMLFSPRPFMCGTEVVTEKNSLRPLFKVDICEGNIKEIRREGDWLSLRISGLCGGTLKKNLKTGETQTEERNILSCGKFETR